jgi:tripartite-type tricarboxylate transporter receptor subunit TctC
VGRPLATTPATPPERLAALRAAFDATVKDPEFIADAERQRLDIRPMPGDTLDKLIRELISAPQDVKDRVKLLIEPGPNEAR